MNGERDYLLDELGDRNAPVGSRLWCLWIANEIRKMLYDAQQQDSKLRDLVSAFKREQGWQELGYLSWEAYCEQKLHKAPEEVEREIVRRAKGAVPLASVGRPENGSDHYHLEDDRGADYLTRRIARDHPDILEDMKQGKYRSVRAAAIDAGIVKPSQRLYPPSDPTAAGRYLAQRVDREWLQAMLDAYDQAQEEQK